MIPGRLFNSNNFATSAALAELYTLLGAILVLDVYGDNYLHS